jgi:uncharacterized Zn-binding protein involved in type VI secretion
MPMPDALAQISEHLDVLSRLFDGSTTARGHYYMGSLERASSAAQAAGRVAETAAGAGVAATTGEEQPSILGTALAPIGFVMSALLELEQSLPAPPMPFGIQLPALAACDMAIALPHAHMHPPSLVPPSVVPIPFPSVGLIVNIPYLSCAMTTLVGGLPAARCGDMGVAFGCGGFFPFYEILTGSSSVWIEGARAARVLDPTQHCTFSARGPTDPPLGPMVGMPMSGSTRVLIGGMPMPSLSNYVVGQLMGFAFRGVAAVFRRLAAPALVRRLMSSGVIRLGAGTPAWNAAVVRDLEVIARTSAGRSTLLRLERAAVRLEGGAAHVAGRPLVTIRPLPADEWLSLSTRLVGEHNASSGALDGVQSAINPITGLPGGGSASVVTHSPERWINGGGPPARLETYDAAGDLIAVREIPAPPSTTSDAILLHELNHSAHSAEGVNTRAIVSADPYRGPSLEGTPGPTWSQRWKNQEEFATVAAENGYRREVGLPERVDYAAHLP